MLRALEAGPGQGGGGNASWGSGRRAGEGAEGAPRGACTAAEGPASTDGGGGGSGGGGGGGGGGGSGGGSGGVMLCRG